MVLGLGKCTGLLPKGLGRQRKSEKSRATCWDLQKVSKFQERKRHININLFGRWPLRWPGVSRPGSQGSKIYVLSSEPKEHKSFCPDTRPGRPVTGVTGQSFMWKSFMCLFCSLKFPITINTNIFAIQKKSCEAFNFVKITKIISSVDSESGHSCLVFVQYPRDSQRSAWELQKKISGRNKFP